jgi:16S rRNA (guanine527-N7)-methyltransferase
MGNAETDKILALLEQGLAETDITLASDFAPQAVRFIQELAKWNKAYNLTAVRDPLAMVPLHILDSIVLHPFLNNEMQQILDVGSGGGLPGIPLALAFPEKKFLLLDSNGKKTRFLSHVKMTLGLSNVDVVQSRVEDFAGGFDLITCRAFASLVDIVNGVGHLVRDKGSIFAMKSKDETLEDGIPDIYFDSVHSLNVPGIDAPRHLVVLKKELSKT